LSGKIEAGFRVILLCGPHLFLHRPYYEPLLWLMIWSYPVWVGGLLMLQALHTVLLQQACNQGF